MDDNTFYKTVSEISVSNNDEPPSKKNSCIYNDDIEMISLDDVVMECTKNNIPHSRICECVNDSEFCKASFHHASVDGLYIKFYENKCHFFLFEFKKYDVRKSNQISGYEIRRLENLSSDIDNFSELNSEKRKKYKKLFNKIKSKLSNKEKDLLKLKAYESVYSVIPQMYIEYCLKNNIDYDIAELKTFLFECNFSFYLVYNYFGREETENKSGFRKDLVNSRNCSKDVYNIQRIRDYNFKDVDIISGSSDFEKTINLIEEFTT